MSENVTTERPKAAMPKAGAETRTDEKPVTANPKAKTEPAKKRTEVDKPAEPRKGQTRNKLAMARVEFKT
jgi:hypothetical protein